MHAEPHVGFYTTSRDVTPIVRARTKSVRHQPSE
jgi:hypothetical protein